MTEPTSTPGQPRWICLLSFSLIFRGRVSMAGRVMGDSQSSWHSPPSAGIVGWTAHPALLFLPTHLLAAAVFCFCI